MAAKAAVIDLSDARSSSTIVQPPPWLLIAASSAAAFAAVRVVSTVKKPSMANFWASAPPTPQRAPTGNELSSSTLPCASLVLRPSACHFEVAPMTTATGWPLAFLLAGWVTLGPFPSCRRSCHVPAAARTPRFIRPPGQLAQRTAGRVQTQDKDQKKRAASRLAARSCYWVSPRDQVIALATLLSTLLTLPPTLPIAVMAATEISEAIS